MSGRLFSNVNWGWLNPPRLLVASFIWLASAAVVVSTLFGRPISDDYCVWRDAVRLDSADFLSRHYQNTPFPFSNIVSLLAGTVSQLAPARMPLVYSLSILIALLALIISLNLLGPRDWGLGSLFGFSVASILVLATLTSSLFPYLGGYAYQGGWYAVPLHYLPTIGLIGFLHLAAVSSTTGSIRHKAFQIAFIFLALSGGFLVSAATTVLILIGLATPQRLLGLILPSLSKKFLATSLIYALGVFLAALLTGALFSRVEEINEVTGAFPLSVASLISLGYNFAKLSIFSIVGLPVVIGILLGALLVGNATTKLSAYAFRILTLITVAFFSLNLTIAAIQVITYPAWWHGLPSQMLAAILAFWFGVAFLSRYVSDSARRAKGAILVLSGLTLVVTSLLLAQQFEDFILRSVIWGEVWNLGGEAPLGTLADQEVGWVKTCVEEALRFGRT